MDSTKIMASEHIIHLTYIRTTFKKSTEKALKDKKNAKREQITKQDIKGAVA